MTLDELTGVNTSGTLCAPGKAVAAEFKDARWALLKNPKTSPKPRP